MKNSIIGIVIGILVTVTAYFAYTVITIQKQVSINTSTILQIVNFLNKSIEKTKVAE